MERLTRADLEEVAQRAWALGRSLRRPPLDPQEDIDAWLQHVAHRSSLPREVLRVVASQIEAEAWAGRRGRPLP